MLYEGVIRFTASPVELALQAVITVYYPLVRILSTSATALPNTSIMNLNQLKCSVYVFEIPRRSLTPLLVVSFVPYPVIRVFVTPYPVQPTIQIPWSAIVSPHAQPQQWRD